MLNLPFAVEGNIAVPKTFLFNMSCAAVAVAFAGSAAAQTTDEIVRIANVGPLTGPLAHLGRDHEFAAKMAIADLNSKGIKLAGKTIKFELISEDDASDPKQGTAVAQKLVDMKVNGIIGHLNSGTTIPASRIYNDAGIPEISPSSTNPKYTRQGFNTAFRVVADDSQLGGALGRYATSILNAKFIAVIDDRTAYGQGVAEEFEKAAKSAGATIVGHEFTTDKATDFNAILTKIKALKPDVIFYGGADSGAGPMLRQIKQLGLNVKFLGGDGICSNELPKLAGESLGDNVVYCAEAGGVEGDLRKPLEDWKAKFRQTNGVDVQVYAPYVYDAFNILAIAMQRANSADPQKYLPEVRKVEYKGITGPIAFDERGDIKNGAITMYTYKNGKRELITVLR